MNAFWRFLLAAPIAFFAVGALCIHGLGAAELDDPPVVGKSVRISAPFEWADEQLVNLYSCFQHAPQAVAAENSYTRGDKVSPEPPGIEARAAPQSETAANE